MYAQRKLTFTTSSKLPFFNKSASCSVSLPGRACRKAGTLRLKQTYELALNLKTNLAQRLQMLHFLLLRQRPNGATNIPSLDQQLLHNLRRNETTGTSDNSCVWSCGFSGSHAAY